MKTVEDLQKLKKEALEEIKLRDDEDKIRVIVGMGTCGIAAGAREIMNTLLEEISSKNINAVVSQTGCVGYCIQEPIVEVYIPGEEKKITYGNVTPDMAKEIVERHLIEGVAVTKWIIKE